MPVLISEGKPGPVGKRPEVIGYRVEPHMSVVPEMSA
jgi:hypothetical protein